MRITLSLFILLLTLSCSTNTPSSDKKESHSPSILNSGLPSEEGFSTDRLDKIDKMIEKAIEEKQIPGAVALIARNGKIIYNKAFGESDVKNEKPFKTDDIFRIASQSKAITSTAVMILWEEGKFQLDQPISDFIPEFKNPTVLENFNESDSSFTSIPADKEITIRHLITHTSGIGYGVIDGDPRFKSLYHKAGITDLFTTEATTIEESVKKLAKLPLHHNPGEKFTYSEGLDVLGYFIEIVSGMPFDQFLRERIFDPIGMDNTWFYLPEEKRERLVPVQYPNEGNWDHYPVTFYDTDYPKTGAMTFFSGGAGLSSTAEDYAKFLQMYLNKGEYNGARILSPTTINTMMTNQLTDINGNYGLAFGLVLEKGVQKGGSGSLGTFDWGGYFNTQYFADPELNIVGIFMKQTQNTSDPTGWKFRQMVFASVVE